MKLSIIIPVFNEEKTIGKVLKRVAEVNLDNVRKEIVIVDDGSTDTTASIISDLRTSSSNFKFIKHPKNKGKGAAVITGIKNSTGDYVIIQDADLEYNPEQITSLLQPITEKKAGVVYGTRLNRLPNFKKDEREPLFLLHYLGNRFLSLMTSMLYGQWITDMETCYKLFPKDALSGMKLKARGFEFEPEITAKLLKNGYKIKEVPISTNPRGYGQGKKLNTFTDGPKAFWTIVKYRFSD
jgi:dolichol-phosphate mannosyltransferase